METENLEEVISNLMQEIEKLKCCGNCKNSFGNPDSWINIRCTYIKRQEYFSIHSYCNNWEFDYQDRNDRIKLHDQKDN